MTNLKNITDSVLEYREATRHLWNTYFRGKIDDLTSCSVLDEYEIIDELLFDTLVVKLNRLSTLGKNTIFRIDPIESITIVPKWSNIELICKNILQSDGSYQFNFPEIVDTKTDKLDMRFIELFDWERYSYVSYQKLLVRIMPDSSKRYADFNGLVDIKDVIIMARA